MILPSTCFTAPIHGDAHPHSMILLPLSCFMEDGAVSLTSQREFFPKLNLLVPLSPAGKVFPFLQVFQEKKLPIFKILHFHESFQM